MSRKSQLVRDVVVSFRAPEVLVNEISRQLKEQPVADGIDNYQKFAWKLFYDFSTGKLHYKNPEDRLKSPEMDIVDKQGRVLPSQIRVLPNPVNRPPGGKTRKRSKRR